MRSLRSSRQGPLEAEPSKLHARSAQLEVNAAAGAVLLATTWSQIMRELGSVAGGIRVVAVTGVPTACPLTAIANAPSDVSHRVCQERLALAKAVPSALGDEDFDLAAGAGCS